MRLIDADAMTADLLTVSPQFESMIHWCLSVLSAQPTIEPKRGRWIQDENLRAVCSECGEPCGTYFMGAPRDRYCKWCGAKMAEGQDDD